MCSSPVMVGVGGSGGGGGIRPSSVETDESIVSRSPDGDHDPIDDQDLSDRVLDQILREHGGTISFGNAVQPFESCFEQTTFPSKAKSKRTEGSLCRVCGDEATGMYFGALVCVPCKTFYLRYAGSNQSFICKERRCCAITVASRTNCKFCRYQKCIRVGMHRKERPCQVHVTDGQQICSVCHDVANGVHFGVITCEGCKKFFRRGLVENQSYVCKSNGCCEVNPRTRNACRFCRYQKCLQVGMSREAIQMGRPSKPRFEKDASSQESSFPLGHFDSSVNRSNGKQTDPPRSNLSPNRSSINSFVPFSSQPSLAHLIANQRVSVSTNSSSGHSSGSRFLSDVLQKMPQKDNQWELSSTYRTHQMPLSVAAGSTCASHWSSIDALSGGEMVQTNIREEEDNRVIFPKQELDDLLDEDDFTLINSRCFELDPSTTRQTIPNDYFQEERRDTADEELLLERDQSTLASSEQSPTTVATLVSSSHSTQSRANNRLSVCGKIDALLSRGKTIQQTTSTPISLPNDNSLETFVVTDDAHHNGSNTLTVNLAETSGRTKTMMDLQFPLKSVIRIIHSSVANELPETQNSHTPMDIEELMNRYKNYWLYDETGEDPFIVHYSNIYKEVIAAYKTFVVHSQYVNFLLRTELEKCQSASNYNVVDVQWIQDNVVPFYVELSIRYCRQLPGFSSFDLSDQQMLIRLGQSPSRILAAAVHWYRPHERDFGDFLSWRRNDQFKRLMAEHAAKIHALDLDLVEASLLNAALIIATDYPNLMNPEPIERQHQDLLAAYKTYTTGKLGTPNDRFQTVISHMREVRHLGFLHYEMTKTKNMMAEDVTQPPR